MEMAIDKFWSLTIAGCACWPGKAVKPWIDNNESRIKNARDECENINSHKKRPKFSRQKHKGWGWRQVKNLSSAPESLEDHAPHPVEGSCKKVFFQIHYVWIVQLSRTWGCFSSLVIKMMKQFSHFLAPLPKSRLLARFAKLLSRSPVSIWRSMIQWLIQWLCRID